MPVDLSTIPPVAKRKQRPSVKRWLLLLLIFLLGGGFTTLKLWPAESATRGALFWHCLISIPCVLWLFAFTARWVSWLVSEWLADGWDAERERDLMAEIQHGQNFLLLGAECVHLPHVASANTLTEQFMLPEGVVLPAVVDEATQEVRYQAQFNDATMQLSDRVTRRLSSLLQDVALQAALTRLKLPHSLAVVIQVDSDAPLSVDESAAIQQNLMPWLPASAVVQFLPQFALVDIDHWLDKPDMMDSLLILSVRLMSNLADGESEIAVALLLHAKNTVADSAMAHVHRPELSQETAMIHASAMQSLQWGNTQVEDVAYLWLAGMGTENKAQALLMSHHLNFPCVEAKGQFTDIDIKSGYTGGVSPWLAIALAAGNSRQPLAAQLIMSTTGAAGLPWWLVVYPTAES